MCVNMPVSMSMCVCVCTWVPRLHQSPGSLPHLACLPIWQSETWEEGLHNETDNNNLLQCKDAELYTMRSGNAIMQQWQLCRCECLRNAVNCWRQIS